MNGNADRQTRRGRPRLILPIAGAALSLLVVACTPPSDQPSGGDQGSAAQGGEWDQVLAAAGDEGAITIYASTSVPILNQAIAAFNESHPGITIEVLEGAVGDLTARIDQEIGSGQAIADMYLLSDLQWPTDADDRGELAALTGPSAPSWPEDFQIGDSYTVSINAAGMVVNTELVTEEVTGYEDLLRPEFAGRLGVQQWTRFIQPGFWDYLDRNHPGMLDQIAANGTSVYRNSEAGSSSVASGELFASMFSTPTVPLNLQSQGAPIEFVIPEAPFGVPIAMGVLAQAPHPNASQAFIDFVLSEDGQHLWNPDGSGQASPLGFGDFDPATVEIWDVSEWTEDEIAESEALWNQRFTD